MTFQHRAGVRPYTSPCGLTQSPVFLVNSRLGLFTAALLSLDSKYLHSEERPFSRSYGAILPSSLTMVCPIASVYSTRPPVSVLVRALMRLPRGFSREHGMTGFVKVDFVSRLEINILADFHARTPYTLSRGRPEPRPAALLRRLFGITSHQRHGNIYPLCIGYAYLPRLSSRLTLGGLAFPRNPWACGGEVSCLTLATHASILTSVLSTALHRTASAYTESSPTTDKISSPLR